MCSLHSVGMLTVVPPLQEILPDGGLRRGSVLCLSGAIGSTSLLLALLSGATAEGSWAAVVGLPGLGVEAAAGFGVALERLVLVPYPGTVWLEAVATLIDAIDLVAIGSSGRCRPNDARRLAARVRDRGAILLVPRAWPVSPDLSLEVSAPRWSGLDAGYGTLTRRRVTVRCAGERQLWLP